MLLRSELCGAVAAVGEGIRYAPAHVGLLHVWYGFVLQCMCLVEQEAALPVAELIVLLAAVGQHHAATAVRATVVAVVYVAFASAHPGTFCRGNHVGPHVVLCHYVLLGGQFAVVPATGDGTCHLGIALLLIIYIALEDAHQVGKHVEVVGIVVSAVYIGLAPGKVASCAPHLCQRGIQALLSYAVDGVPYLGLLALALHIGNHFVQIGGSCAHLVTAYVYVGCIGKDLCHLVQHLLQHSFSFCALHVKAHGTSEGCAVSRHVYLGDNRYAVLLGRLHHLAAVLLCVVLAGEASHGLGRGKLRISLHLEAPCLVLCHVPVEGVHLEAREQLYLLYQFPGADERAAHVVHVSAQLECRPVRHLHGLQGRPALPSLCHLHQCLRCAYHTGGCHRRDVYGLRRHLQGVCLVLVSVQFIVVCAFYALHHAHVHSLAATWHQFATVAGQELLQQGT